MTVRVRQVSADLRFNVGMNWDIDNVATHGRYHCNSILAVYDQAKRIYTLADLKRNPPTTSQSFTAVLKRR